MTVATDRAADPARGLLGLGPRTADHDPTWLAQLRQEASGWVAEHGFPTTKDEDWRYTRLGPVLEVPFELAGEDRGERGGELAGEGEGERGAASGWDAGRVSDAVDALGTDLGGTRLVFVNGRFSPQGSRLAAPGEGVCVTSLASVVARGGQRSRWSPRSEPYRHAFEALNAALAEDGAFVELAPGAVVTEPIELVFLSGTGGRPLLSSPRSVILAGPDSRATVVETYAGVAGDRYCTNAVTEVVLAEGARVDHHKVQDESERAFHLASLDVRQGRGSHFSSQLVSAGAQLARHEVVVRLEGEDAEVDLDGLYLPRGDQHHDNPVLVEHAAPRCTSRQLYKGIVDDHGHGVFNGHIVVRPGASGTDATQTNKNLLLSDQAEVDTRPRLEIFADDVLCVHGAAVGRLDEDALFYLRSRGIPHDTARDLLTHGFADEMVARWHPGALKDRVEKLLARGLAAGAGGGSDGERGLPPAPPAPATRRAGASLP